MVLFSKFLSEVFAQINLNDGLSSGSVSQIDPIFPKLLLVVGFLFLVFVCFVLFLPQQQKAN